MTEDKRENQEEVTPKGAVEVDEQDLDQVAGGAAGEIPMDQVSLNYSKIEIDRLSQKVAPQDASIGLLREGEKEL